MNDPAIIQGTVDVVCKRCGKESTQNLLIHAASYGLPAEISKVKAGDQDAIREIIRKHVGSGPVRCVHCNDSRLVVKEEEVQRIAKVRAEKEERKNAEGQGIQGQEGNDEDNFDPKAETQKVEPSEEE